MTDGLGDQIFEKVVEMLKEEEETSSAESLDDFMPAFLETLPPENMVLFMAAQFLGREALIARDSRIFYASTALLQMTGILAETMGEEITMVEAMDHASESFDHALKMFDNAVSSITDEAFKEMGI